MKHLRQISEIYSRWLDAVAGAIIVMLGWFVSSRTIHLVEGEDGVLTARARGKSTAGSTVAPLRIEPVSQLQIKDPTSQLPRDPGDAGRPPVQASQITDAAPSATDPRDLKGARTEIELRPSRFVFREIELPRRASEFLDGVIRAQVDRLTPWNAKDAVFGWDKPDEIANDRIVVTVVATARAQVMPFVQSVTARGAESVAVTTIHDSRKHGGVAIKVLEHKAPGSIDVQRVRRALVGVLMVAVCAAGVSIAASLFVAGDLAARQDELARRIADGRAALRAELDAAGNSALARLERRKHEKASTVIAIEALSQVLPDHTYVTELRIEGSKMQVIGITRDAPSLIRLIEQSPHFTRATFFAPTTRSPSDPGERFHIEARVEPVHTPRT